MSKANHHPKKRRSFRIIFKIIKLFVALVTTFVISFTVTLFLKVDNPVEQIGNVAGVFFHDDEKIQSAGVPEIKTVFDELNNKPFDSKNVSADEKISERDEKTSADEKVSDRNKKSSVDEKVSDRDKKSSADEKSSVDEKIPAREENPPPPRNVDDSGFFDSLDRMTSIKPAVDEKIKTIPNYTTHDKMPPLLLQAVVAVEDQRFYEHRGFDLLGIARAAIVNVEAGEIQEGASTITQQTVKNLFLTSEQTFSRKFEELVLSVNMEKDFSKDKILEIYLNVIYFGSNFYGIHDAAHGYFGKDPADLTIAECAMLAGLPNAPSVYSPYVDFHLAKKRQLVVIDAMEKVGVITKTEAESARIEEIVLAQ